MLSLQDLSYIHQMRTTRHTREIGMLAGMPSTVNSYQLYSIPIKADLIPNDQHGAEF